MEISDELIACYVEGIATTEEQKFVRKYLCEHPEEYERILCLMDYDTIDFLGEQSKHTSNYILKNEDLFSDIVRSAAAFVQTQNNLFVPNSKTKIKLSKTKELSERLSRMSDELDDIIGQIHY